MKRIRGIELEAGSREERLPAGEACVQLVHLFDPSLIAGAQLAAAAYLSERECFRLFRDYLHTTPSAYLRACRLQRACQLLTGTDASLTEIGHACGLGSSSYFGRQFRQAMGCTPSAYRRIWRDRDKNGQK